MNAISSVPTDLADAHAQLFARIHDWQHQQSMEHFQPGQPVEVYITAEAFGWLAMFLAPPDASWRRVDDELQKMAEFVRQNRPPLADGHSCFVVDNAGGEIGLIVAPGWARRAGWNDSAVDGSAAKATEEV